MGILVKISNHQCYICSITYSIDQKLLQKRKFLVTEMKNNYVDKLSLQTWCNKDVLIIRIGLMREVYISDIICFSSPIYTFGNKLMI